MTGFDPIRNASDELALSQGCTFDAAAGERPIRFIETFCKQSKGRWAGQPLTLLDWQKDFLRRLFGWRKPDGKRRFRRFYLEVAKKNGKSTLMSALLLYLLLADGEGAPEVYCNATDRDQASIVFDEAARMIRKSPELAARLNVVNHTRRIIDPASNGKLQACSADVPSKDGVNASAVLFDELHRQKTREMWDVFEYAGASREQPLTGSITTAGEDADGVWHEQRDYSEKVNAGIIPDTSHLGVVYRALDGDDIEDPATWRKANPSMGATLSEADFARELAEARAIPTKLANFKRLRLDLITRGDAAFCRVEDWDLCSGPPAPEPGPAAYFGLDLSQTQDLTALVVLIGDPESGFDVLCRFWLPEDGIEVLEQQHQQPYRTWAELGLVELTPGNVIDYSFVRSSLNELASQYPPAKVLVDPYNATKLAGELKEQDGLPVEYLRQGFLSLSAPTKELLRLILGRKLRHGGHPILKWHVSNSIAEQDAAGNIKLSKRKSKKKIDGAAALVNAVAAASSEAVAGPSVYEERGLLFL